MDGREGRNLLGALGIPARLSEALVIQRHSGIGRSRLAQPPGTMQTGNGIWGMLYRMAAGAPVSISILDGFV
ncbi:hypothetical protein FRZ44_33600 [Hypericibacter terrae]|uniref:Uncharacterized protein n=1 Tax=Hypericibacter terrae TaxID=2602015 RepID=A0A5J6MT42_9PROT|nr:hypothetical protein FRZ44_33600 [Hypericibacter terrae]